MEDIQKIVNELILKIQQLEDRIVKLENSEFSTGIYLDGCSDSVKDYIQSNMKG